MLIFMAPEMNREAFLLIWCAPLVLAVLALGLLGWGFW